ncbi:MAG TPA: gluconate 2-dehydrogenase subunit 3 family protein, partial [Bryobacteraceae bacterium]
MIPDSPDETMESPESLTRRLWLRRIGETAATFGVFDQLAVSAHAETQQARKDLPAGLYEPSREHLSHAMMQQARFHVIPPDCPTDYVRPPAGPFSPQFFSQKEFAIIHRITTLFLGATPAESPVVDEVAQWIDLAVFSSRGTREAAARLDPLHVALIRAYVAGGHGDDPTRPSHDPQQICSDGLRWLREQSMARYHAEFRALSSDQQIGL